MTTVADVINALKKYPQDLEIGLCSWYSPCHSTSHGKFTIRRLRLHFGGGKTQDIIHLGYSVGNYIDDKNGYCPEIVPDRDSNDTIYPWEGE